MSSQECVWPPLWFGLSGGNVPPAFRADYKKSPPLNFRGGDFLFSPRKPLLQTASNLTQVSEPSVQLILLMSLCAD